MKTRLKSQLRELEKTSHLYWNISPETGNFLNLLIKDRQYKTILEIGSSNGYSGIWLAEALKTTDGHLYTMESNLKIRYPLARATFKKSGLRNITLILGHAPEAIPTNPRHFDLAFFDATKEEHLEYFEVLKNRIKKGGMIVTDNIISHEKALKTYIKTLRAMARGRHQGDATQNLPNWHSTILNIGSGLMLSLKL